MRFVSVAILATALLVLAPTSHEAGSAHAQDVDKNLYYTKWTRHSQALEKAKQYRVGVLWFFPPEGSDADHPMFSKEPMAELSARAVVVKVGEKCGHKEIYRKRYEVPKKYMTFVLTDYYGNKLDVLVAKRGGKTKIKVGKKFAPLLKDVQTRWIVPQRQRLAKTLVSAEKNFKAKRWSKALKGYLEISKLRGFKDTEKAQTRILEIVDTGEMEIKKAKRLAPEEAIKRLKRIAKEFRGCSVEQLANKAVAELESDG